jgi:hypothetical protein
VSSQSATIAAQETKLAEAQSVRKTLSAPNEKRRWGCGLNDVSGGFLYPQALAAQVRAAEKGNGSDIGRSSPCGTTTKEVEALSAQLTASEKRANGLAKTLQQVNSLQTDSTLVCMCSLCVAKCQHCPCADKNENAAA